MVRRVEPQPAMPAKPLEAASQPVFVEAQDSCLQLRPEGRAEKTEAAAREGWRGWLNTTFRMHLAPSVGEQNARARRARIQRPLDTHRTIATVELKGGATKTTVTYHLAATYGWIRGGNVLAGEFNENQGT